jgi:acyl carrier protein
MDTAAQIRAYFQESFLLRATGGDLDDAASLLEAGVVDSTGILEVVLFLEETFKIDVRDDEIVPDNFDSVQRMARFVERKMNVAATA